MSEPWPAKRIFHSEPVPHSGPQIIVNQLAELPERYAANGYGSEFFAASLVGKDSIYATTASKKVFKLSLTEG